MHDAYVTGIQEELDKFLQERGINEGLALFIPEYAQFKEQKVRQSQKLHWCLTSIVLTYISTPRQNYIIPVIELLILNNLFPPCLYSIYALWIRNDDRVSSQTQE